MGRSKARPTKRSQTDTIVGAAAIAASASSSHVSSALGFHYEDVNDVPTTAVEAGLSSSSPTSTSSHRHQTSASIVTPIKYNHNDKASCKKKRKGSGNAAADDDDDDDALFDQSMSVMVPRKIIDDDEGTCAASATASGAKVLGKRRRIFEDDVQEEKQKQLQLQQHFTINSGDDGVTLIKIPSSAQKIASSTSDAYELMQFHLPNTKIVPIGDSDVVSNTLMISLETIEAVETILKHCHRSLDSDDVLFDTAPIVRAFEDGMLDVALKTTSDKVDVSIRLLMASCLEKMPCRNRSGFTKPSHPSYTLLQALGGIFKGSIFDNVAKSLANRQLKKDQRDSFITAKMVYSVVDNVHAGEFEGAISDDSSSSLDIPGLVPTLRPYQDAAVRWMLKREGKQDQDTNNGSVSTSTDTYNNEWELCWFAIVEYPKVAAAGIDADSFTRSHVMPLPEWKKGKSAPDERQMFCNPFAGRLAPSYEEAKNMMLGKESNDHVKGGILAESMGLGKTVEVLACILANPSPLSLQANNTNVQMQAEGSESKRLDCSQIAQYQKRQTIACNRITKPSAIQDAVCICGRSNSYSNCLSWVVCAHCSGEMHGRCAGFESEEELVSKAKYDSSLGVRMCARELCPTCVASSVATNPTASIIESRATLIVTPPAILAQWQREISRHTKVSNTGKPLKVAVYPGVRDLCNPSSPHEDFRLVHPRNLANADVVLVTYQTLMSEMGHSDENPFAGFTKRRSRLRSRKRYVVVPSPLTSIIFWRICLDEAQRVEAPTAASARMAQKLITDKRWCISGTPIGRGRLDDLYGLLLFLSFKPFDEKSWFSNSFVPSHGDALERLSHLLQGIMWRSTKANKCVRRQMGIPEQEEQKVILQFSSVEKYFYGQQYEETSRAAKNWTEKNSTLLNHSLQKLRAACCHPQVGASGIGGRVRKQQGSSTVLSMDQILEKLIDDSKAKCEEAQRISILHTIGLAGLTKLEAEAEKNNIYLMESMKIYKEAIDSADTNASPTEVIGHAVLSGSLGFRLDQKIINNGAATLDWQIKESPSDVWSGINFAVAKKINCISVRACHTLPSELQGEAASSWTILRPKLCILQMSSATAGGGFVDVQSFTLSDHIDASEQDISGFRAPKSKAWRLVIRSYHNNSALDLPSEDSMYYIGIDVRLLEPEITNDPLQRLHILHNASIVLSTLVQADDGEENDDTIAKLKGMESEGQVIHNNYMAHAQAVHRHSKHQLSSVAKVREKFDKELNDLSECSDRPWYEDVLAWFALYGDEQDRRTLCEAVRCDLLNYYENMNYQSDQVLIRDGKFPHFNTVDGLNVALAMRIQQGKELVGLRKDTNERKCAQTVMNLSSTPEDGEVYTNSHCRRCRADWQQTGPICSHCHLEEDLNKTQRLSNDPEISCILKSISKFVKDCHPPSDQYLESIRQRSSRFFAVERKVREEIRAAKLFWKAHFELLSDIDELNQCKRAMRLREEGEDISTLTETETAFIIEPSTIAVEKMQHEVKQAAALGALRRAKDSLRYLKNQRLEKSTTTSNTPETCSVCLAAFECERSVLPCGHCFHPACVDRLFKRSGASSIRCPMRCPVKIRREDVLVASDKSKDDGSRISRSISGDWGTKVNRLIGDVMDALQMGDKGIIFSQWEEMMDIVAEALGSNQISFIRPRSGKRFGEDIKRFRSSDVPILLMNIKNGAEGLTLTEANHVFMLEPILNSGLDAQAINRIHRIGQLSKTFVHRYIVANTIEEKLDAIRMERQENHYEDDLQEQQKHSIKGGGIDGGFDVSELHQLFG
mmetsp:Transcript_20650/g.44862  ORF Transcript_20650/g.44862 Transcript_20650/m.44862 type:complete len:1793 (-) Transcript_20650:162-5540(-)|eukprot:CAMPEP_0172321396 /NCGR_PEP_ID=MMETSP1058-20130122/43236_1 /TAXON_ID=83371 /ORGANISM="Detonula confervacea, Strain CCMP 353" /LENGTH=1792 /DNA_ID=CAMNT_0013036891 /DNA_START=111 /DNA_END=5489 /DNA_ORIENTATION=-